MSGLSLRARLRSYTSDADRGRRRSPFPRESVFRTYRDDLPALIEFLPHVRRIEAVDRQDVTGGIETRHTWHGGGDIPIPVQRGLGDNAFPLGRACPVVRGGLVVRLVHRDARLPRRGAVRGASHVRGFGPAHAAFEEIKGSMSIDLGAIKALPSFLADGLAKTVEQFVSRQITANLLSVSDALTRYLDSHTQA